jgi:SAM-dependent methyltransferase
MARANYALAEWRSSIAPLTLIVGAEIILNRAGVIVLGFEGSIEKAGIFGIALSMAMLPTRPLNAVGQLIEPLAARCLVRKDRSRLQALHAASTRFSLITAILIAVPLLLLTDPLLDWLGEDFEQATNVFRILVIGQLVAAAFGPQQHLMTMAGHERTAAATLIVGATLNVLATIAANRLWGMTGAAAATAGSVIVWNLALAIFMRLRQQIGPGLAGSATAAAPAIFWDGGSRSGTTSLGGQRQRVIPQFSSYREGSTGAGYGRRYVKTFAEGFYALQWREIERPLLRGILTGLAARGATRSLDFACGTGRILELHEETFPDVVGTDIAPEMLAFARKRYPGIRFVEADLTRTGAIEAVANREVCTAFRFFLNAEPSLRAEVLDVLRNCLVDGGTLVANFHGNPASLVGLVYPIRNRLAGRSINKLMSESEAVALLEAHGFEVEELHWYGVWPPIFRGSPWLNRLCMARAETLGRRFPALMRRCQTFVIVARRR